MDHLEPYARARGDVEKGVDSVEKFSTQSSAIARPEP